VKARLAQEFKSHDYGGEEHFDAQREWYHAEIVEARPDGTYAIEWEHGYEGDKEKRTEDLQHVFVGDDLDGVSHLLRNCKSGGILCHELPIFIALFLLVASLPELIFMLTTQTQSCV
jgi:hypothetical protein